MRLSCMARAGARGVRRFARTGEERAAELFGVRSGARRAALRAHRRGHAAELYGVRWGARRAALCAHRRGAGG